MLHKFLDLASACMCVCEDLGREGAGAFWATEVITWIHFSESKELVTSNHLLAGAVVVLSPIVWWWTVVVDCSFNVQRSHV